MPRDPHDQRHRKGFRVPDSDVGKVFPNFAVTVDCVVLTVVDGEPHVLLAKRELDPFAGEWALPGGFKRVDETLEEAVARQLREKVGVVLQHEPRQLRAYGHPHRDPRPNIVTVVFVALEPDLDVPRSGRDVTDVAVVRMDDAIQGRPRLAFDHEAILADARDDIAWRLEFEPVVPQLLGDVTTLVELRNLYEAFWQDGVDRGNLRRALLNGDHPFLVRADSVAPPPVERPGGGSGRPPDSYRLTDAWNTDAQPIRRPRPRSMTHRATDQDET